MKKSLISICLLFSLFSTAQNEDNWDVHSLLPSMGAVVAFKQLSDGTYCQIDVRGNNKLTPDFIKPSGGSDPLTSSDIPVCNLREQKDFQKQAENSYLINGHAQKTAGAVALIAGGFAYGCFFGVFISSVYGYLSTLFFPISRCNTNDCRKHRADIQSDEDGVKNYLSVFAGFPSGLVFSPVLAKELSMSIVARKHPELYAKPPRSIPLLSFYGLTGGISGAILCEKGTTYLLTDNPKTNL